MKRAPRAIALFLILAAPAACGGDDETTTTASTTDPSTSDASTTTDPTTTEATMTTAGPGGTESSSDSDATDPTDTTDPTTDPTTDTDTDVTTDPPAVCGDGVVEGDEACDDGNDIDTDECLTTCELAACGDGFLQEGVEECDDANDIDEDECPTTCQNAVCGDGFLWEGMEECDSAGEAIDCDDDCTAVECGDANVNEAAGEECDDANDVNTDECLDTCAAASCGDGFLWDMMEQCDDGNLDPDDGCDEMCMSEFCDWDVMSLPLPVNVHPNNFYGDIAWDANCNLLVTSSFIDGLYRVSGQNGVVTKPVAAFGVNSVNGVAYRPADDLIYVSTDGPSRLYTVNNANQVAQVASWPSTVNAIALAPEGFGAYGGQIIGVSTQTNVFAYNPANQQIAIVGTGPGGGILSGLAFSADGQTLYVVNYNQGRVDAVNGAGVFTPFFSGLNSPDGIALDTDGTRMFVAHYAGGSRIDQISIPGAMLTAGPAVQLDGGYYVSGLIVDASDDVIYKTSAANMAQIASFNAP